MGRHRLQKPKNAASRKLVRASVSAAMLAAAVAATAGPAVAATNAPAPAAASVAPAAVQGTSIGAQALRHALTQQGKPYVWGAEGPNAYDCSGLVQWAFKQVGVNLPRTSAMQSKVGAPVSRANLQPGDLVFFYSPVSHVGFYVGDGKILHAPRPGQSVKISSMAGMPFHNARRI